VSETDPTDPPEERDALDWVMDRLVYGPYGALTDMTLDPIAAAESGRRRLEQQVRNARFLGEMTVTHGSRELKRRVSDLLGAAARPKEAGTRPASTPRPDPEAAVEVVVPASAPDPIDHILADYDDLSASQVVKLLDSLSIEELRSVAAYEQACRGRRTILTRAGQLIDRA
jgi:hypothetical protein